MRRDGLSQGKSFRHDINDPGKHVQRRPRPDDEGGE
jgi:hypothetical protein